MNYKNSLVYVQRQIDKILRSHRVYARVYVDDIVIYFKILKKHLQYLHEIFDTLDENNISIKLTKVFLNYLFVQLLDQKIDFLRLTIVEDKLRAISMLRFSRSLRQLKIYLDLINWLRKYVSHYASIFKSLQIRKIELLKDDFVAKNARKAYSSKIKLLHLTKDELSFFRILQKLLFKSFYLIYVNSKRPLYVNLDASKKFDFDEMIYHIKNEWKESKYSLR